MSSPRTATMTELTGPLPRSLCALTALRRLCICRCNLVGPIPAEIGQLTALEELQVPMSRDRPLYSPSYRPLSRPLSNRNLQVAGGAAGASLQRPQPLRPSRCHTPAPAPAPAVSPAVAPTLAPAPCPRPCTRPCPCQPPRQLFGNRASPWASPSLNAPPPGLSLTHTHPPPSPSCSAITWTATYPPPSATSPGEAP